MCEALLYRQVPVPFVDGQQGIGLGQQGIGLGQQGIGLGQQGIGAGPLHGAGTEDDMRPTGAAGADGDAGAADGAGADDDAGAADGAGMGGDAGPADAVGPDDALGAADRAGPDVPALRRDLLAWYDGHGRPLPWRAPPGQCPDPYAVFVSEVMLQQTRVETVRRHYGPWMERFPDWKTLAAASEQEVMAQWAGLGYYRRARHLHAAARHVAAHGVPTDAAGLAVLPGVGPYMTGAVASIAWGQAVPAVDGNVVRVVTRVFDVAQRADRAPGRRAVAEAARRLVDPDRPGDWNQAVMDLGATVCTPRPRCGACPVAHHCTARAAGTIHDRPVTAPRARPLEEEVHFALVRRGSRVLLVCRPEGLLAGTWMLPGGPAERPLEGLVREQTGICAFASGPSGAARHTFTHRVWHMQVVPMAADGEPEQGRWVDPAAPDVALSAACLRALAAADAAAGPAADRTADAAAGPAAEGTADAAAGPAGDQTADAAEGPAGGAAAARPSSPAALRA